MRLCVCMHARVRMCSMIERGERREREIDIDIDIDIDL